MKTSPFRRRSLAPVALLTTLAQLALAQPTITTQPQSVVVDYGATATFTVVATGAATYQWKIGSPGVEQIMPGETNATLTVPGVRIADVGKEFQCVVTDASGTSTTSQKAIIFIKNTMFIEAEDANFDNGHWLTNTPIGMNGPYDGGSYAGRGSAADAEIDWSATGPNGQTYRPATGLSAGKNNAHPEGVRRGTFDVKNNWVVGWNNSGNWYNYTRNFPTPAADYNVVGRLSSGGSPIDIELDQVTSDPTQGNQTVTPLGSFTPGRATPGGWDSMEYFPLTDTNGNPAIVHIGGTNTIRISIQPSSNEDEDYLMFIPVSKDLFSGATATFGGYVIKFTDVGLVSVDPKSIQVNADGTAVPASAMSATKTGIYTTAIITTFPPTLLASGSTHTLDITFKDSAGKTYSANGVQVKVAPYNLIPESFALKASDVDTTKPGFFVRTWQSNMGLGNSNARSEQQLFGELGPNTADLSTFTDNTYFDESAVIDYPSGSVPGIPGTPADTSPTENFAMEFLTVLNLPTAGQYTLGVNSDDGFRTYTGTNELDRFQIDDPILGEFDNGRGRADSLYSFVVTKPGFYPFRTTFEQGGGGYGVTWFSVASDGTHVNLNDTSNPAAIKAYRKIVEGRAYIKSVVPGVGIGSASPTSIVQVVVVDATTKYITGSAKMQFDGADVTSQLKVNSAGGTNTISYNPGPMAFGSKHSVGFSFDETTAPTNTTRTVNFAFTIRTQSPNDLPAVGAFWIEAEDWDFSGGQTIAAASVMPYAGGAYTSSGTDTTKFDIDYHNDDAKDSQTYRSGGDLDVADAGGAFIHNVDTYHNSGGRYGLDRPGFTMTDNWTIGWIGTPDWFNYTRTIPTNVYNIYVALSWGGDPAGVPNKEFGSLDLVTSGWGTKNQSLARLGTFNGASSGAWGSSTLLKMQGQDGTDAVVKLGGTNTLRFNADQGDYDWFVLTTTVAPAKVAGASPIASVHGEPRNSPIDIRIANLSTKVVTNTIKLMLNGVDVTSSSKITVSADGDMVTVHEQPALPLPLGSNTYTLTFSDNGTPPANTTFTSTFVADPRGTAGQFLIEAEDFDSFGTNVPSATTMPYLGGAYNNLSAQFGIDYVDHESQDSLRYRVGGDLAVKGQGANMDPGPGDFNRGSWTNTVNHKIGWVGSDDWYNYTRTFPTNNYQVWVALSHGNAAGELHDLKGTIALVTSGVGTTNQTVAVLGICDAPSTGTWGLNNLVQMTDTNGVPIVVPLGGTQTVQFQGNSGDYDYLLFVPGTAPLRISKIQVSGSNLLITWSGGGTLESTTTLGGTWTAVAGSPGSPATVPIGTNKTLYFRIKK